MKRLHILIASIIIMLPATLAQAYVIIDSPSPNQLSQDQSECANWARYQEGTSGQTLQSPAYSPVNPNTGPFQGMARGAVAGAAIGAGAGYAGRGAALGALGGSMNAGMRSNESLLQQSAQQDVYNHAFNACMQSRGYDVD